MSTSPAQHATGSSYIPGQDDNNAASQQSAQPAVPGQQLPTGPLRAVQTPADLDKIVATYLQRKGYKMTEAIFLRELNGAAPINVMTPDWSADEGKSGQDEPDAYNVCYKSLREWIDNSLDWYKHELRSVLFPIFVHAYLGLICNNQSIEAQHFLSAFRGDHEAQHAHELRILETVLTIQHVVENEYSQIYRNNKYNLCMSSVPFELFLNYLQDNKFSLLLRIVNHHLNIQVVHGKLSKSAGGLDVDSASGITGYLSQQVETLNEQPLQLGMAQMDPALREEIESVLKEQDQDQMRRDEASGEMHPYGDVVFSLLDTFRKVKQDATFNGPAFGDIPLPTYRGTDIQTEIESLKDLGRRLPLGSMSLPSICCYTFHNSNHHLRATRDITLMAGGFDDARIKVWSLSGDKLRGFRNTINPAHVNDYADLNRQRERHGSEYKTLTGHEGPVYGLSFSPDNRCLLSASEDGTARLWSMDTFTNLAVFRGHDYPVWDVDCCSQGLYFATASHDRTARIWSFDQISPLRILAGHLSDVDTVRFHPNTKYVATGSSDCTARLWNIQDGSTVRVFTGHTGAVKTLAISPNGHLLATAGEDKVVSLWDIGSGKRITCWTEHTGFIHSLCFSADNQLLASGSEDNTVRIWDTSRDFIAQSAALMLDSAEASYEETNTETKSRGLLGVYSTKNTPIIDIQFSSRNLCLAAGAYCPPSGKIS